MVRLLALMLAWLALWPSAAQAQAKVALVIGNAGYSQAVGPLLNPRRDAALVAQALRARGFAVTTVNDAGRVALLAAIRAHGARLAAAGPDTISFFYYSGHGVANPADRRNYLVPVDATTASDDRLWDESVPLQDLVERIGDATQGTSVVVFDACRDALKLAAGGKSLGGGAKGLVREGERKSTLIAFSTAPGATAADQDARAATGPYATELAKHLGASSGDLRSLFDEVKYAVLERTGQRQQPWVEDGLSRRVFLGGTPTAPANLAAAAPVASAAPAVVGLDPVQLEALSWQGAMKADNAAGYSDYLKRYPQGSYAALARANLDRLTRPATPVSAPTRASTSNWNMTADQVETFSAEQLFSASNIVNRLAEGRSAAEGGDPVAAYLVGLTYNWGRGGLTRDDVTALGWYQRAADGGLVVAWNSLGNMYYMATGTKKDCAQALFWWRKAAAAGSAFAQKNLNDKLCQ